MSEPLTGTATSADGTTIGYRKLGAGPALVIWHGSLATGEAWLPFAAELAVHFTVYVPDRRGRGLSGPFGDGYDTDTEIADLTAIVAASGETPYILGHSYGASMLLRYALTGSAAGYVFYEPPLPLLHPVAGEAYQPFVELVNAGRREEALELGLVKIIRVPEFVVPMIKQTPVWTSMLELSHTWIPELRNLDALPTTVDNYASISAPVLGISGTNSPEFLINGTDQVVSVVPNGTRETMPDQDHFAHLTDPAGFAKRIIAWAS